MIPIDTGAAELDGLHPKGPALCQFAIAALPRLQITIAILRTIASSGGELASIEINEANSLHQYKLRSTRLPVDAATGLASRITALDGVASATLERWRLNF